MCTFVLPKVYWNRNVVSEEKLHYLELAEIENIFHHWEAITC